MAPASASPQPPSGRSDTAPRGAQGSDIARSGEHGQDEHAPERHEVYGPLSVERHAKQDGRALILYAREERQDQ